MTYVIERERYSRTEKAIDLRALAADLARELGGTVVPDRYDPQDERALVAMPDGLEILLRPDRQPLKVEISGGAPAEWNRFLGANNWDDFPSCTVSDKELRLIVSDVRRKVVEASAEPLAKRRGKFEMWTDLTAKAKAMVADLGAKLPGIEFWVGDRRGQDHVGPVNQVNFRRYDYDAGIDFDGRISVDGDITFNRLRLPQGQGLDLLATLTK